MNTYKTYQDQAAKIKALAEQIAKDAQRFADAKHESPYFGDLQHTIAELEELAAFTKNFK